jgi:hypothetical protein
VIYHFTLGATAEQIVHKFPALDLGDVYAVIAYYLTNRQSVDDYIQQQDAKTRLSKRNLKKTQNTKPGERAYANAYWLVTGSGLTIVTNTCGPMLRLLID